MWRNEPLFKMAVRMLLVSIWPNIVAEVMLQLFLVGGSMFLTIRHIPIIIRFSAPKGIGLAIALLLVTVIFFPVIRRPAVYRFTMLSVAVITSIVLWLGPILDHLSSAPGQDSMMSTYIMIAVGNLTLLILMCNFVLDAYIRESQQRHALSQAPAANDSKKKREM